MENYKGFNLFHITTKSNWLNIQKQGLIPSLSDITLDAITKHTIDKHEIEFGYNLDIEEVYEEISEKYIDGLIFVTNLENIVPAMWMIANKIRGIDKSELVILAIDPKYEKWFEKKEIASDIDYISTKRIPSDKLYPISIKPLIDRYDSDAKYYNYFFK